MLANVAVLCNVAGLSLVPLLYGRGLPFMRRILVMLAVSALMVLALSVPAFADVGNRQATCGLYGQPVVATEEEPGFVGSGTSELAQQENLGQLVSPTAGACNQSG
jgi:hypothetical protein